MGEEAIYKISGSRVEPTEHAAGPWDPTTQHGAAVSALFTQSFLKLETRVPMQIMRLTIDLMKPVPLAPVDLQIRVVREGRKIQLCEAELTADGVPVARATALKVRTEQLALPEGLEPLPITQPLPDALPERPRLQPHGFNAASERRGIKDDARRPTQAAAWFRHHRQVIAGETTPPTVRAASMADYANGNARVLDGRQWRFLNADITVHMHRPPIGEWILLETDGAFSPRGMALISGRLGDVEGYFGRTTVCTVVDRQPDRT